MKLFFPLLVLEWNLLKVEAVYEPIPIEMHTAN